MANRRVKNFAAKRDFTEEMLPNNRRMQFFMILQNRIPLLFKAGIVTFAFFIPLLIVMSFKTVCVHHFWSLYNDDSLTYELMNQYISYTELLAALVYVPCITVASIGIAGLNRLTHQLVFGEGILFREDYILGIKNNAIQYSFYTFVISMLYLIAKYLMFRFSDGVMPTVLMFVIAVVVLPYFLVLLLYSNVYSSRGGELIRNVFYAMTKGKCATLCYSLFVAFAPIAILLLSSGHLFLFLMAAYILISPIISLVGNSVFANVFDDAFNYYNNVEIVKRGLYVSPEERKIIEETHLRLKKQSEKQEKTV